METRFNDVTLRDGLQAEAKIVPLDHKVGLFEKLSACGYSRIEITSFVSPKWIPQLADSRELCERIFSKGGGGGANLMAFVPNRQGLEALLAFPIGWAAAFVATSATFNKKNVNRTIDETLAGLGELVEVTRKAGRKIRIYVSTVFGCPYEGEIPLDATIAVLDKIAALRPDDIALSDTIGVATPQSIERVVAPFAKRFPVENISLHLHDTYGMAGSCAERGHALGVRSFDGSTGGVGGCPYAKGATGNVAIDELMYRFHRQGWAGRPNLDAIRDALVYLDGELGLPVHSRLYDIIRKGGEIYGLGA